MGRDFLQKKENQKFTGWRSWAATGLCRVFVDVLPDHFHKILDVRVLGRLRRLSYRSVPNSVGTWIGDIFNCPNATVFVARGRKG